MADNMKSGRQSTPQDRMSGNTPKEQLRSNWNGGMSKVSQMHGDTERPDLSTMANDSLFQNVEIKKSNR